MKKDLTIVSWNIAGGHPVASGKYLDYSPEDLEYFAAEIRRYDPDIICLQESHTNDQRSNAGELAALLDVAHVYNQPMSPSHIDKAYRLGMAVLSKTPLKQIDTIVYDDPSFPLLFADGRTAIRHAKGVQILMSGDIMIANTQLLPLHLFGASYAKGKGKTLADEIEATLIDHLRKPLIFVGDFNVDVPEVIFPELYKRLHLREALPSVPTRPAHPDFKRLSDHMLYSDDLTLIDSKVHQVKADHYLCVARFRRI